MEHMVAAGDNQKSVEFAGKSYSRYGVTVDQYRRFRRDGFIVVPQLVPADDIAELREHTEELMAGNLPEQQLDLTTAHGNQLQIPKDLPPKERAERLLRIHMLHRLLPLHERYMLHPRVLDVLEVFIGPDVLAMQTMLFTKAPGQPGQGWHQDSFYIPTHPDTLCGAWIAIDDCDEMNGAMWFAKGSGIEPVYPPADGYGFGDKGVEDITYVSGVSDVDDSKNCLSKVADQYDQVLVPAKAGDVVFFNGHVLHRSKKNFSTDRYRRSFVSHYCNARSYTQWGTQPEMGLLGDEKTGMANQCSILARGNTHLPFAKPKFGTPCAALMSEADRKQQSEFAARMMGSMKTGLMDATPANPNLEDVD
jgi:ectoine hydroxylase-related dioxygenase (phytanoyl-CoA dioxygenase family)